MGRLTNVLENQGPSLIAAALNSTIHHRLPHARLVLTLWCRYK
jgi:hypothetical protein